MAAEGLVERLRELASHDESVMRDHYQQIGRSIPDDAGSYLEKGTRKELGGYAGRPAMVNLVDDLMSRYSNRPAMIAELRKTLGDAR
jgi:hypothetical protein